MLGVLACVCVWGGEVGYLHVTCMIYNGPVELGYRGGPVELGYRRWSC